jgi:hypothetical protein
MIIDDKAEEGKQGENHILAENEEMKASDEQNFEDDV